MPKVAKNAEEINYKSFAKELMKLCLKYGVNISAYYLGHSGVGKVGCGPIYDLDATGSYVILENFKEKIIVGEVSKD